MEPRGFPAPAATENLSMPNPNARDAKSESLRGAAVGAIENWLAAHGLAGSRAAADSLWSLAQRARQHWAHGEASDNAGPGPRSWAIDEAGAGAHGAFARLCLRAGRVLEFVSRGRMGAVAKSLSAHLRVHSGDRLRNLEAAEADGPLPPARLSSEFLASFREGAFLFAEIVSKKPGFDPFGMVLRDAENRSWDERLGILPASLDGAMSPFQAIVGFMLDPASADKATHSGSLDSLLRLAAMAVSHAESAALREAVADASDADVDAAPGVASAAAIAARLAARAPAAPGVPSGSGARRL
jgi:hypothetical protein